MGKGNNNALIGAATLGPLGAVMGMQADSAQSIAEAKNKAAQNAQDLGLSYAAPSGAEIAQMNKAVDLNNQEITRTQKLLDSADPNLIELGKQTLAMMTGSSEVGSNKYLRQDLADSRTKLVQGLTQKYGTGYASTSAGIQALNDFDRKAGQTLEGNRESQINTNLAYLSPISARGQQAGISNTMSLAQLYGNQSSRQANVAVGTGSNLIGTAGASDVGTLSAAQSLTGLAGQAIGYFGSAAKGGG